MVSVGLEQTVGRAVDACNETLQVYASEPGARQRSFASSLVLAVVAFETAAAMGEADPRREGALLIAATLGHEAALAVHRHGLDEPLLRCAYLCTVAARACEEAARP